MKERFSKAGFTVPEPFGDQMAWDTKENSAEARFGEKVERDTG